MTVSELQGYYGTLNVSEKVIQEIWDRGDFLSGSLRLTTGKSMKLIRRGQWNHHEGPDFRDGVIEVNGKLLEGDVEIHLYPEDWQSHGHSKNPEFNRVVLHVSLFEPRESLMKDLPEHHLVLLPYLMDDLESLVARSLVRRNEDEFPNWADGTISLSEEKQIEALMESARKRWSMKVEVFRHRLETFSVEDLLYQTVFEVMGYRRNRAVMHELSLEYSLSAEIANPDEMYHTKLGAWRLSGVRPANHPLRRLRAYSEFKKRHPDWIRSLLNAGHDGFRRQYDPPIFETVSHWRRTVDLSQLAKELRINVLGGLFGERRFNTFIVDAFLPIYSASQKIDLFDFWFSWYPGDMSDDVIQVHKYSQIIKLRSHPDCNGWYQGWLDLKISQAFVD